MSTAFISHSWHDKRLARRLATTLHSYGVEVWVDEAEIKIGDSLIEKIREGIDHVDFVIALLSTKAVSSQWVKKELDIAMTQEIEGKAIKVLPVLAEACEVPGFLQGKFYADISTKSKFNGTLPMLLDRLGVDPIIAKGNRNDRNTHRLTPDESARAQDLIERINCDDMTISYEALCDIIPWEDKHLFNHLPFLNAIADQTKPGIPEHIRYRAIELLGRVPDRHHSDYLAHLLRDDSTLLAAKAIRLLGSIDAYDLSYDVLEIMNTTSQPSIRQACLAYFGSTSQYDRATVLTISRALSAMLEDSDVGTLSRIAKALGKQWQGSFDCALEPLLLLGNHEDPHVRMSVLTALSDEMGMIYVSSPRLRKALVSFLRTSLREGTDSELGKAWISAILSEDIPRYEIWEAIIAANENAVESFLDQLEDYNIHMLLDRAEDAKGIAALLEKHPSLKLKLSDVLAETHVDTALQELAAAGYEPVSWAALHVVCGLTQIGPLDEGLRELFEKAAVAEMPNGTDYRDAFALVVRVREGDITIEDALSLFPRLDSIFANHEGFKAILRDELISIRANTPKDLRRRLSALIKRITNV